MKWWDQMPWSSYFKCWVLSQLFHSLLSPSSMTNLESVLKSKDITFFHKSLYSQSYGFSSSHVWMCELDQEERWAPKNWCFPTAVLEKALESHLGCKEIKAVDPKGNQPWVFVRRTAAEVEAPIIWPPDVKSQLIGKRLWTWQRLRARGEGDNRGWNSWLSSPTQWTWVWASSRSWRWTGRPGELQSRRWQTVGKTEGLNNNRSHYPRKWWMSKEDHHISIWYPH